MGGGRPMLIRRKRCPFERTLRLLLILALVPVSSACSTERVVLSPSDKIANASFGQAVRAFDVELAHLTNLPLNKQPEEVRRAIELLAEAIALIPLRGGLDLEDAVDRIKRRASKLSTDSPVEWTSTAKEALFVAAANLANAGALNYGNAPGVAASVTPFQYAIAGITEGQPMESQLANVISALQSAKPALHAIEAASLILE